MSFHGAAERDGNGGDFYSLLAPRSSFGGKEFDFMAKKKSRARKTDNERRTTEKNVITFTQ